MINRFLATESKLFNQHWANYRDLGCPPSPYSSECLAETHVKVQMRQEGEHPGPGLKTQANQPPLLRILLVNVLSLENKLTNYEAAVLLYSITCLKRACYSCHWGYHMAAANKSKMGRMHIYVSNGLGGNVQTNQLMLYAGSWALSAEVQAFQSPDGIQCSVFVLLFIVTFLDQQTSQSYVACIIVGDFSHCNL